VDSTQNLTTQQLEAIASTLVVGDYISIEWRSRELMDPPFGPFATWIGKVMNVETENEKPLIWIAYHGQENLYAFPPRSTDTLMVEVRRCENKGRAVLRTRLPDPPAPRPREELGVQGPPLQRTRVEATTAVAMATEGEISRMHDIIKTMHPAADMNGVIPIVRLSLNAKEDSTVSCYKPFFVFQILRSTSIKASDVASYVNQAMTEFQLATPFMKLDAPIYLKDKLPPILKAYIDALVTWKADQAKNLEQPTKETYMQPFSALTNLVSVIAGICRGPSGVTMAEEKLHQQWRKGVIDVVSVFDEIFSSRTAAGGRPPGRTTRQQSYHQGTQRSRLPDGSTAEFVCRFCHQSIKLKTTRGRPDWKEHTCSAKTH